MRGRKPRPAPSPHEVSFAAIPPGVATMTDPSLRWRTSLRTAHEDCAWQSSMYPLHDVPVFSRTVAVRGAEPSYLFLGNQNNLPADVKADAGY